MTIFKKAYTFKIISIAIIAIFFCNAVYAKKALRVPVGTNLTLQRIQKEMQPTKTLEGPFLIPGKNIKYRVYNTNDPEEMHSVIDKWGSENKNRAFPIGDWKYLIENFQGKGGLAFLESDNSEILGLSFYRIYNKEKPFMFSMNEEGNDADIGAVYFVEKGEVSEEYRGAFMVEKMMAKIAEKSLNDADIADKILLTNPGTKEADRSLEKMGAEIIYIYDIEAQERLSPEQEWQNYHRILYRTDAEELVSRVKNQIIPEQLSLPFTELAQKDEVDKSIKEKSVGKQLELFEDYVPEKLDKPTYKSISTEEIVEKEVILSKNVQEIEKTYDEIANDGTYALENLHPTVEAARSIFERAIPADFLKGKRVLDLAIGPGLIARNAAQKGAGEIVGLDISQGMLEKAKKNLEIFEDNANIKLIKGDVFKLEESLKPLEDTNGNIEKFDVITIANLFKYYEDPQDRKKIISNAVQFLKEGGYIVILYRTVDEHKGSTRDLFSTITFDDFKLDPIMLPEDYTGLLKDLGVKKTGFYSPSYETDEDWGYSPLHELETIISKNIIVWGIKEPVGQRPDIIPAIESSRKTLISN